MNNPDDMPIDSGEMIAWIKDYRERKSLSWEALGKTCGIPAGTISAVCGGSYAGDLQKQARRIFRFKQQVESQAVLQATALKRPKRIETPTSKRIQYLFEIAQMGRVTVGALGPGNSKTITAEFYDNSVANVWLATMLQSTKSVMAMCGRVLDAMNLEKTGSEERRSAQVMAHVAGRGGLLIIDEANFLDFKCLEEIRGWHDATGVGICLLGNEELILRIRGSAKRHAYARLSSRIANYLVQDLPIEADVTAYLDAMDIIEPDLRKPLIQRALSPGHGGLREVQQILESAKMLSIADHEPLSAKHLTEAISTRAMTILRNAA